MFTHLLQIASFKSSVQNFSTPTWALVFVALTYIAFQGFALGQSPGNEMVRMFAASALKLVVVSGILYAWLKSVDAVSSFASSLMALIFIALLAEFIKLPLAMLVRETKATADLLMALVWSVPLWATIVWQYAVWYYVLKQVAPRGKGEIIAIIIALVLISEVVGSVLSKIGSPVDFGA